MGRWWLWVALVAGCGRLQFEPLASGDGGADAMVMIDAPDGAIAGACPSNAIFCEDFESGNDSKWSYVDRTGTTILAVNTARPHAGMYALEAQYSAGTAEGQSAEIYRFNSISTGTIAVREWINQPVPMINFDLVMSLRQTPRFLSFGADGLGNWITTEQVPNSPQPDLYDHLTTIPAPGTNTWVCVELVVQLSSPQRFQIYANGTLLRDDILHETMPAYTELSAGVTRGDMAGYHVFVDDVVIAPQRIGC